MQHSFPKVEETVKQMGVYRRQASVMHPSVLCADAELGGADTIHPWAAQPAPQIQQLQLLCTACSTKNIIIIYIYHAPINALSAHIHINLNRIFYTHVEQSQQNEEEKSTIRKDKQNHTHTHTYARTHARTHTHTHN